MNVDKLISKIKNSFAAYLLKVFLFLLLFFAFNRLIFLLYNISQLSEIGLLSILSTFWHALALDIAQEAFIKVYRALPQFRGDSAFYTWMYRIAVNTAKNYLAAQRRRPANVELDLQDPEQYDLHAKLKETDTPEGITLSNELRETVERAIAALPEDLRTAIILRELEGMSYEEIAQTMECPVGTVRSRIFRARDAIGKKVGSMIR